MLRLYGYAVDIAPTILDFCAVQTPSYIQGRSIHTLLHQGGRHKEHVLVEYFDPNGVVETTVRTESYKYYLSSTGRQIMYDLKNDPKEINPLGESDIDCEILAHLRYAMLNALQRAAYTSLEPTDEY